MKTGPSIHIAGSEVLLNGSPAVARDDSFSVAENVLLNGNVITNVNPNGADSDPESDPFAVTEVNDQIASVGNQIQLASGALLTLNADGTFTYNPNGAFDALPGPGSGASNLTGTDTFSYTVTGGDKATATVTVTGVDSDDTLRGTAGDDALAGGIGNDSYFVENAGDAITEAAGQGTLDRLYAAVSYGLAAGVAIEWMATTNSFATTPIDLTGNEFANTIYGNAGANVLNGGGGNDVLSGLGGDDTLDGGAGDDKLYGGAGQNDMAGGTGNDWYIVDSLTDVIVEAAGEGTKDRVFTTLNYTLTAGAHVEIMSPTTIFTGAINLTGNELANTIYGNNNVNVLNGLGGNDVLVGYGGADTLNGGDGNDKLYGGTG
jgi:VCBS repeat-containing protein